MERYSESRGRQSGLARRSQKVGVPSLCVVEGVDTFALGARICMFKSCYN